MLEPFGGKQGKEGEGWQDHFAHTRAGDFPGTTHIVDGLYVPFPLVHHRRAPTALRLHGNFLHGHFRHHGHVKSLEQECPPAQGQRT